MKILIDTNILISAALFPGSTPELAFIKAVTFPNKAMVCQQNIDELRRIFSKKFPNKLSALESFLSLALTTISIVPTPSEEYAAEREIRDVMDRPILRAAIYAGADILITGDKDFLESDITNPCIISASDFLKM